MNTGKVASRTFLIFFLSGLACGLILVVTGHATFAEYSAQAGGGLVAFFGLAAAGLGYFLLIASVLGAGIPWGVTAYLSRRETERNNNGDESDPVTAEIAESDGSRSTVNLNDVPSNLIRAAWKGDEKLWKVFWIYYWLFAIALGAALDFSAHIGVWAELVVRVIVLVWLVWVVVAQWRCSFNCRWRGWGYVVRALLLLTAGGWVLDFVLSMFSPEYYF